PGNERADEIGVGEQLACQRVLGAPVGIHAGGRDRRAADAEWAVENLRFGGIEERRLEVRGVIRARAPIRVPAHAQPVIQRQPAIHFPLVLPIPLNAYFLDIGVRARRLFSIVAETADERIRIRVAGIAESGGVRALIASEAECSGPISSRGLAIPGA